MSSQVALVEAVATALGEGCRFLRSSYGPLGLDKLVLTSNNQLLVTNSGHAILPLFPISNVVAQHAMKAIMATATRLHDGSSTLLLMVEAGLTQVLKHVGSHSGGLGQPSHQLLLSLMLALGDVKAHLLPRLLDLVLEAQAVYVDERDLDDLKQVLQGVIHTAWAGKTGSNVSRHLEPLVVDLVMQQLDPTKASNLTQVCRELASHPPVITVPGRPVSSCQMMEGLLLRAAFSSRHMPSELHRCKFVVMDCSFEIEGGSQQSVHAGSQQLYQQLQGHKETAVRHRLQLLKDRGVQLLLCTEKVSELTSFLALECDINIIPLISKEDVGRICSSTGILPVTSNVDTALIEAAVGTAKACRQVALSTSCKVILLETETPVHTLALCAPSEGLGAQYTSLVRGVLHLLTYLSISLKQHEGVFTVSGGGAFDAAMAVRLEELIRVTSQGSCQNPLLQGLRSLASSPSLVTAALKVLLAMALSPLNALASSAARQQGWVRSGGCAPSNQGAAPKLLVEDLLAVHRVDSKCHMGLVAKSMASRRPVTHQDDKDMCWMCVADPAEYGILEAAAAKSSLWQAALDILHQVIRLDAVLPSRSISRVKEAAEDEDEED